MRLIVSAAMLMQGLGSASAQDYPKRPVKLIIPFSAGGVTDIAARVYGKALGEELGQSIVVENRPGAAGRIGTEMVARSAPDGYTLVFGNSVTHGSLAASKKLSYNPEEDFTPIAPLYWYATALVCNPAIPAKSLQELISYARTVPKPLSFANAGVGSANHFMAEYFSQVADLKITHVPYRGTGPALQDVTAGVIDCTFDSQARQYVEQGSLKAFATSGAVRDPLMATLPTMQEAGLKDYELVIWIALLGPKGMPAPIMATLVDASKKVLKKLEEANVLAPIGLNVLAGNSQSLGKLVSSEVAKYKGIAQKLSIELE